MSVMIERVGRAVLDELGIEYGSELLRDVGIAALAAMREPTPDMLKAAEALDPHYDDAPTYGDEYWGAMIDAALK